MALWGEVPELGALAAGVEPPAGEAGAAAALAPAGVAGEAGEAPGTALGVASVLIPAGLPPVPPSIVKGPANARSGEVPSSKASENI